MKRIDNDKEFSGKKVLFSRLYKEDASFVLVFEDKTYAHLWSSENDGNIETNFIDQEFLGFSQRLECGLVTEEEKIKLEEKKKKDEEDREKSKRKWEYDHYLKLKEKFKDGL